MAVKTTRHGCGARCCSVVWTPPPSFPTSSRTRSAPPPIHVPGCCAAAAARCAGVWSFTAGCLFWAAVTVLLACLGLVRVAAADHRRSSRRCRPFRRPCCLLRYHWLRSEPLPAQRPANVQRLPPLGSAARPAMSALGASERGFFSLLGVMERAPMLPDDEIARLDRGGQPELGRDGRHRQRGGVDGAGGALHRVLQGVSGSHHQRVHRAVERRCPSVQRNGHRRSAIGLLGERGPSGFSVGGRAAALPARAAPRRPIG